MPQVTWQCRTTLADSLANFPMSRGSPAQMVGLTLGVPGGSIFAVGFVPDWESVRIFAVILIFVGTAAFGLGTWRNSNRVLVYTGGIVHKKLGTFGVSAAGGTSSRSGWNE